MGLREMIDDLTGWSIPRFILVTMVAVIILVSIAIVCLVVFFGATLKIGPIEWKIDTAENDQVTRSAIIATATEEPVETDASRTVEATEIKVDITIETTSEEDGIFILPAEAWKTASRIKYSGKDGFSSGVGFVLPPGKISVVSPVDVYMFEYGHNTPTGYVGMIVLTMRADWTIEFMDPNSGTDDKNLFVDVSGWTDVHPEGKIKKGEVILTAEVTAEPRFPGIFDKDYNFLFYPNMWWNNSKKDAPSDPAEYIRYFISDLEKEER